MNVEVKSKTSGEKTVVPIDEVRKGIKYGKDLTGYEKNMLGNGIGKMESKDYVYTVINSCVSTNPVVQNALAACNGQKVYIGAGKYGEVDEQLTRKLKSLEEEFKSKKGTDRDKVDIAIVKFIYDVKNRGYVVTGFTDRKVVKPTLAAQGVARSAEDDDYQAIANETRKVLSHLKAADGITVANVMKSIKNNGELANKSREMWKHISEAQKLATYIIQYND